ncbi:MAG: biopolymer transporter ExbB [Paracoccaceae bacterium]|nr:biopolymer transporter ExbB [Paracoccaceae bacterium]
MRAPIRLDPQFSQPVRQVTLMLIVLGLVGAGGWFAYARIFPIFIANPWLNGLIAAVFVAGVLACFWQVVQLVKAVSWIESFAADRPGRPTYTPPQMLAPLASLLGARGATRRIATSASRSILESVATRIDEARDITRYLASLLIFLGLLGTFYGLATTVPAVVETIRALAPQAGESAMSVFDKLMTGLEAQLGGMGTAFSSSLLGLAGSLVVGLLELFVTHGQNRFYRELEEWISTITRLSFAGNEGEGETAIAAEVLDHMAEQMDALQTLFAQSDAARAQADARLAQLAQAVEQLALRLSAEADARVDQARALSAMAAGQERLITALDGLAERAAAAQDSEVDAESRMRLRSIDVQLLRLLEEVSAGRQESMAELRNDFAALTRALLRGKES